MNFLPDRLVGRPAISIKIKANQMLLLSTKNQP
jgi:hypothetical protein